MSANDLTWPSGEENSPNPRVVSFTDCCNFYLNMSRDVRSLDINAFVAFFSFVF